MGEHPNEVWICCYFIVKFSSWASAVEHWGHEMDASGTVIAMLECSGFSLTKKAET